MCHKTQWITVSQITEGVLLDTRIMKYIVLVVVFVAVLDPCLGVDPVSSLNITRYLGRWYQMYADQVVMSTFERNGVCITADYTLRKDSKIGVLNSQRIKTPIGELSQITGYAYVPDPKDPGKLKVHFDVAPVDGDYWIIKLGPQSFGGDNMYEYSVVTDRLHLTLFVLARDPQGFQEAYDKEIKDFLMKNGFSHFWNKPIETLQSKECKYAPPKTSLYQTTQEYLAEI